MTFITSQSIQHHHLKRVGRLPSYTWLVLSITFKLYTYKGVPIIYSWIIFLNWNFFKRFYFQQSLFKEYIIWIIKISMSNHYWHTTGSSLLKTIISLFLLRVLIKALFLIWVARVLKLKNIFTLQNFRCLIPVSSTLKACCLG